MWNHRVVKRDFDTCSEKETRYYIAEAYYDENGKVFAITDDPVDPGFGESIEELKQSLEWMQKCLEHPVLDYDKIPEEGAIDPFDAAELEDNPEEWK